MLSPMPLIVDCYNLLHTTMPPVLAGLEEASLCRLLARSVWRGRRMVVVCDGAPKPLGVMESPVDEVELIYAGIARSADDVIVDLINESTSPRRLTVVSSDREIQKAARRRRAHAVSSDSFINELLKMLSSPAQGPPPANKPAMPPKLSENEVDRWLNHFGIDPNAPEYKPKKKHRPW